MAFPGTAQIDYATPYETAASQLPMRRLHPSSPIPSVRGPRRLMGVSIGTPSWGE
jgi:hypothetical protein